MQWAQAILFCGGLIYAAVDDLRTRTVSNIVCIVIALAGLITISPASLLGALLAMLPFYLCAGFGLMGGGDWRLAAAVASNIKPFQAADRIGQVLGSVVFRLPYSQELEEQYLAGELLADLSMKDSRAFRKEIDRICEEVF